MPGEIDLRQTQELSLSSSYAELQDRFRDTAVRDLLWLLASPGLLRAGAGQIPQALAEVAPERRRAMLDLLWAYDAQPARLHERLAGSPQKRLGHYAEQLLAFFLGEGVLGRLIAANLPLRRASLTLGECDFLLEGHGGERLHWELAVKCYLYVDEPGAESAEAAPATAAHDAAPVAAGTDYSSLARYVGPNLADRFDLKLSRMVGHQLPLSARPEFRALVAGGPWQAELFLRGWLFYPLAPQRAAACHIPALLNPRHMRGWWASFGDWQRGLAALDAEAWMILPRLEWMAQRRFAVALASADGLLDAAGMGARLAAHFGLMAAARADAEEPTMLEHTHASGRDLKPAGPWLIAGLKRDGAAWVECTRGFVVDDDWFARARVYAASRQSGKATRPDL